MPWTEVPDKERRLEPITFSLNGQPVSGLPGRTILELAREQGIDIPTLCHHPLLSPAGACRVCVVEDESRGVLLPACVTAIAPGLVLQTHSPRVLETRRTIVRLLLASHPESCLVCDKGNRCRLRALAAELGIGAVRLDPMPQYFPTFDFNPFFKRDMSKCILCGRCLRGDQELVVEGVLDYVNRGFTARPATFRNRPLEEAACTFCGTCLSLCPTGALTETNLPAQGTTASFTDSVCGHCACGCSLRLETQGDRIIRVTPGPGQNGWGPVLCVRGHFGFRYIHSPERLRRPLVRENGRLVETSWEEALARLVRGLRPDPRASITAAVGCLAGPHLTNEEYYLFQKLARLGFHTPHVDNGSRLAAAPAMQLLIQLLGRGGATHPLENILNAGVILVAGANPSESAPIMAYLIKRALNRGARLIVLDPRRTRLAEKARPWLRPQPGADLALIRGLTQYLLSENLWNQGFVHARTEGFLEWKESFLKQNLQTPTSSGETPPGELREAASALAAAQGVALVIGSGATQQLQATALIMALFNLLLLTGQWEKPETGIYPLLKENNVQGAWDLGVLPGFLPGYRPVSDPAARQEFEARWAAPLPSGPAFSALEMLSAAQRGELQALLVAGEDPLGTYPDRAYVEDALDRLPFLAVQDLFLTDTAQKAQVVLPTRSFAEKAGTVTNLEHRIRKMNPALPPLGEARSDGEIFCSLLEACGVPQGPFRPEAVFREIQGLVPAYGGLSFSALSEQGVFSVVDRPPAAKAAFQIPKIHLDKTNAETEFPFTLISGGLLFHLGAGTRTVRDRRLQAVTPEARVSLSPQDAERLGIASGETVRLRSRRGAISLPALIDEKQPPGVLFLPLPYPELRLNRLLEMGWDPLSKGFIHKHCPVQLEKTTSLPDREPERP